MENGFRSSGDGRSWSLYCCVVVWEMVFVVVVMVVVVRLSCYAVV